MNFSQDATETLREAAFAAAESNNFPTVRTLLAAGADPNATDDMGTPILCRAAQFDRLEMAQSLLEAGANPNISWKNGWTPCSFWKGGWTPLMAAVTTNSLPLVRLLLTYGAEVNLHTATGKTALSLAASKGSLRILDELLAHGANVQFRDAEGDSALTRAAAWKCGRIVRSLLAAGAEVGLREATLLGNLPRMRELLTLGENRSPNEMAYALRWAAGFGKIDSLRLLLAHGAEVDAKGKHNTNALSHAASRGEGGAVRVLVAHGADVNALGVVGMTPLIALLWRRSRPEVETVRALLDAGAEINAGAQSRMPGFGGTTALIAAATYGATECARLLIERGADLERSTEYDEDEGVGAETALLAAVWNSHLNLVRLFVAGGADVNNNGGVGRRPLHLAREQAKRETRLSDWSRAGEQAWVRDWAKVKARRPAVRRVRHQRWRQARQEIVDLLIAAGGKE